MSLLDSFASAILYSLQQFFGSIIETFSAGVSKLIVYIISLLIYLPTPDNTATMDLWTRAWQIYLALIPLSVCVVGLYTMFQADPRATDVAKAGLSRIFKATLLAYFSFPMYCLVIKFFNELSLAIVDPNTVLSNALSLIGFTALVVTPIGLIYGAVELILLAAMLIVVILKFTIVALVVGLSPILTFMWLVGFGPLKAMEQIYGKFIAAIPACAALSVIGAGLVFLIVHAGWYPEVSSALPDSGSTGNIYIPASATGVISGSSAVHVTSAVGDAGVGETLTDWGITFLVKIGALFMIMMFPYLIMQATGIGYFMFTGMLRALRPLYGSVGWRINPRTGEHEMVGTGLLGSRIASLMGSDVQRHGLVGSVARTITKPFYAVTAAAEVAERGVQRVGQTVGLQNVPLIGGYFAGEPAMTKLRYAAGTMAERFANWYYLKASRTNPFKAIHNEAVMSGTDMTKIYESGDAVAYASVMSMHAKHKPGGAEEVLQAAAALRQKDYNEMNYQDRLALARDFSEKGEEALATIGLLYKLKAMYDAKLIDRGEVATTLRNVRIDANVLEEALKDRQLSQLLGDIGITYKDVKEYYESGGTGISVGEVVKDLITSSSGGTLYQTYLSEMQQKFNIIHDAADFEERERLKDTILSTSIGISEFYTALNKVRDEYYQELRQRIVDELALLEKSPEKFAYESEINTLKEMLNKFDEGALTKQDLRALRSYGGDIGSTANKVFNTELIPAAVVRTYGVTLPPDVADKVKEIGKVIASAPAEASAREILQDKAFYTMRVLRNPAYRGTSPSHGPVRNT